MKQMTLLNPSVCPQIIISSSSIRDQLTSDLVISIHQDYGIIYTNTYLHTPSFAQVITGGDYDLFSSFMADPKPAHVPENHHDFNYQQSSYKPASWLASQSVLTPAPLTVHHRLIEGLLYKCSSLQS
ncbi:hypothetical protein PHYBLDRAFT_66197 [Phycomyces blakesleeanus NRRL 1555(-)]|uniref:Uncharacterized protein n=2 Tax=Phycomyces blakesleeanus TaxID=4837 RepID=A0A163D8T3_PHYB8|nr:hypothetical protein PHYBLDRAFT_66197 [Phycomyces blakesleeanus NRRL 1555(-)]OAD69580.1 hypothetical protein PHYBLDRAFT_66197 [Phycomyces blakesleeanus NRRL 1555(-)]|eukprot:XP_018287620.1 hypothetical protein PHYBLDRAFT_66197 [Phycomyces blakesleeanus NRRL 1555(-)]